jgi:hypothetical protein
MNVFALSRRWFDFCFKNPELIRPSHTAIYFFAIEHCNRMGWKRKYGFPTTMVMEAVGIKSYTTYKQTLDELVEWGFIEMVERTKNQFSSNIIALSFFDEAYVKATDEALDKALSKHASKQRQSIVSIDIQKNQETLEQTNKQTKKSAGYPPDFDLAWELYKRKGSKKLALTEWKALTDDEKKKVHDHIPAYIANTEPKYVKDFERYLKHGKYESETVQAHTKSEYMTYDQVITAMHKEGIAMNRFMCLNGADGKDKVIGDNGDPMWRRK